MVFCDFMEVVIASCSAAGSNSMVTVPAGRKESPLDLSQEESDSRYLYRHYLTQHSQLPRLIQSGSAKKTESTTSWLGRRFMGGKPPVNPKIRARPKTSRPRWIHRKDNSPILRQEAVKTVFSYAATLCSTGERQACRLR